MKKVTRIVCGVLAFALIGSTLFFANALLGNPVSQIVVKKNAQKYISQEYPDMELELEKPFYDFKTGSYAVGVSSPYSIDTNFKVTFSHFGKLVVDSYDNCVANKFNTWMRVDSQYGEQIKKIVSDKTFPYKIIYFHGGIPDNTYDGYELDKKYDIDELGKAKGKLTFFCESQNVNLTTAYDMILAVKNFSDEKGVGFYSIDFELQLPRNPDGTATENNVPFRVSDFLYSDIGGEDFEKKLVDAEKETKEKDDLGNAEKQKEIDDYEKNTKK